MKYTPLSTDILAALKAIVGEKNLITDADRLQPYSHDEVANPAYHHMPEALALPESTEQAAAIVKLANERRFPIIPRGAGTGLACGAVPIYGGLVVSLEKMNRILEINGDALYAVVEAGVRTSDLQAAAEKEGLFYAGDPCSSDSCCIGGNIATNAGGNRAVKYGTTRHQVQEITVVNPLGEIVRLGSRLKKQSTGYCLDQLVIGSEGTLGIITAATVRLLLKAPYMLDILAVFKSADDALNTVQQILKSGIKPTCIEFIDTITLRSIEKFLQTTVPDSECGNPLIIELEADSEDELDDKTVRLDELCTAGGAVNVLAADSERIWKVRKSYSESIRSESRIVATEDIVVPVDRELDTLHFILTQAEKYNLTTRIAAHAGDGNIHLNILKLRNDDYDEWKDRTDRNQAELFTYVYCAGGRLSGEHGIGYKRRHLMERFADPVELSMMRAVKKALDPNNVLNPGKIFTLDD